MDRNFACFWPPNFFGGEPPEFLKLNYKIGLVSNHVAKFHGDRPRDLGDYALEKKETPCEHYISPPVTPYGRPNKNNVRSRWDPFSGTKKYNAMQLTDRTAEVLIGR